MLRQAGPRGFFTHTGPFQDSGIRNRVTVSGFIAQALRIRGKKQKTAPRVPFPVHIPNCSTAYQQIPEKAFVLKIRELHYTQLPFFRSGGRHHPGQAQKTSPVWQYLPGNQ